MSCLQLPEEARELEKELRQITKEKNDAVRTQDFEKVQNLIWVRRITTCIIEYKMCSVTNSNYDSKQILALITIAYIILLSLSHLYVHFLKTNCA